MQVGGNTTAVVIQWSAPATGASLVTQYVVNCTHCLGNRQYNSCGSAVVNRIAFNATISSLTPGILYAIDVKGQGSIFVGNKTTVFANTLSNSSESCNQVLVAAPVAYFTSSNYPQVYDKNQKCYYYVSMPSLPYGKARVFYHGLNLDNDTLKIELGYCESNNYGWTLEQNVTIIEEQSQMVSHLLLVGYFTADGYRNQEQGFNISVNASYQCNHILTDPVGTYLSPDYPFKYPTGHSCNTTILGGPYAASITLTVNSFEYEDGYDYVGVFGKNIGDAGYTFIQNCTGDTCITGTLDYSVILFWSISDGSITAAGANISYQVNLMTTTMEDTTTQEMTTTTESETTTVRQTTTTEQTTMAEETTTTTSTTTTTPLITTTPVQTTTASADEMLDNLDSLMEDPDAFADAVLNIGASLAGSGAGNGSQNSSALTQKLLSNIESFASNPNITLSVDTIDKVSSGLGNLTSVDASAADKLLDVTSNLAGRMAGQPVDAVARVGKNFLSAIGTSLTATSVPTSAPAASGNSSSSGGSQMSEADRTVAKAAVEKANQILETVASLVYSGLNGTTPVVISGGSINMALQKSTSDDPAQNVTAPNANVAMPGVNAAPGTTLLTKMVIHDKPPHSYSASNKDVNSPSIDCTIKDSNGNIMTPTEPVQIESETGRTTDPEEIVVENGNGSTSFLAFTISDPPTSLLVTINRRGDPNDTYTLIGNFKTKPTETTYLFKVVADTQLLTTDYGSATGISVSLVSNSYRLFVSAKNFDGAGTMYIGVTQEGPQAVVSSSRRLLSSGNTTTNFTAQALTIDARVWNATTSQWETSTELEIAPESTGRKVVFKSNFFGSFAAGLFEPPNTIDFDAVFANFGERLAENAYVFGFLIGLVVLYIILVIFMRRRDLQDRILWAYAPLSDNKKSDTYYYRISVLTGLRSSRHLSANVYFILHGELGKTRPRVLSDGQRKCLQSGTTNNYIMGVPKSLGKLTNMQIWHDGKGKSPHWLLRKIIVYDVTEKKRFFFTCGRWLSHTKGEKRIERLLTARSEDEIQEFNELFEENASKNFFDDHLWISVFTRPTSSRFSRVQRVSVCIAMLFLAMIANAMFFKGEEEGTSSSGISLGPITITFRQVYVGFIGSLLVVPPTVIMIEIFRRAKPRVTDTKKFDIEEGQSRFGTGVVLKPVAISYGVQENEKKMKAKEENGLDSYGICSTEYGIAYPERMIPVTYRDTYFSATTDDKSGSQVTDELLMSLAMQPFTRGNFFDALGKADAKKKKEASKPLMLPWGFIIVGYVLVILSVAASGFFTLLYSLQWGKEKALDWLLSMFFSFTQSFIIIQPIKVVLLAVAFSCISKLPAVEDEDDMDMENIDILVSRRGSGPVTVFIPHQLEEPGDNSEELKEKRASHLRDKRLMGKLQDVAVHLLHLFLLIVICFSNRDDNFFLQNYAVRTGFEMGDISFGSFDDIWTWLDETIVPGVFPTTLYNGDTLDTYETQFIRDLAGLRLGPLRLRQVRVRKGGCSVVEPMYKLTNSCIPYWEDRFEVRHNHTEEWDIFNLTAGHTMPQGFEYKVQDGPNDFWYNGLFGSYPPSGYIVDVSSAAAATATFTSLKANNWLDRSTRAVFVEFTINNAFVNVFTMVRVAIEFPVTGGMMVSATQSSFRPYPYVEAFDFVLLLIQIIWAIFVIYFFVKELILMFKMKLQYFYRHLWHVLGLCDCIMAFLSMAFFVLRTVYLVEVVEEVKNNIGKFVPFDRVVLWDDAYSTAIALDLFLAMMQLFAPLSFSESFAVLKSILKRSFGEVMNYVGIFVVLLYSFSAALVIETGDFTTSFKEIPESMYRLFGAMLGILKYADLREQDSLVMILVFVVFAMSMNFILLNMFMSIINDTLSDVKEDPTKQEYDRELNKHLMDKIGALFTTKKAEKKTVRFGLAGSTEPLTGAEVSVDETSPDPKADNTAVNLPLRPSSVRLCLSPSNGPIAEEDPDMVKSKLGTSYLTAKYYLQEDTYLQSVNVGLDLAYLMEKTVNWAIQSLEEELGESKPEGSEVKPENKSFKTTALKMKKSVFDITKELQAMQKSLLRMVRNEIRRVCRDKSIMKEDREKEVVRRVVAKWHNMSQMEGDPDSWEMICFRSTSQTLLSIVKAVPGTLDGEDILCDVDTPNSILNKVGCEDVRYVMGALIAFEPRGQFELESDIIIGIPVGDRSFSSAPEMSLRVSYDVNGNQWETVPHTVKSYQLEGQNYVVVQGRVTRLPRKAAAVALHKRTSHKISPAGGVVTTSDCKNLSITFDVDTFEATSTVSLQVINITDHQKRKTYIASDTFNLTTSLPGQNMISVQIPFAITIEEDEEIRVTTKYGDSHWYDSAISHAVTPDMPSIRCLLRLPTPEEKLWFRLRKTKNIWAKRGLSNKREMRNDAITDEFLLELAPMLGSDWEKLGKELGLSSHRVAQIAKADPDDTSRAVVVLRRWSQSVAISVDKPPPLRPVPLFPKREMDTCSN
ncbi:uncharacterized protein LOC106154780 [Lingula anatina]|uniref:Uncharacterized protein LOC106154780 n=1 Tax=Lingula anatina TaxID=7574 RepID=A0A1S3HI89_LINAN|nr:uncharacterized protein LOC106154780 [Lingula anatina]|eukprot:XP_013384714.1 uncharacterized protein LOC106154780 [Lingula anatina]